MNNRKLCPLCGNEAERTYQGMIGYVEGQTFDIYECSACLASFADPLTSNSDLYNHIYRQVHEIPGYMRYARFADLVTRVSRPLDVLANLENTYWAIRESLSQAFGSNKQISVLEIGSGLGYLTYSLRRAGYQVTGLELSKEAVHKAKERYGHFYEAGDLFEVSKNRKGAYDCIVMTELIEHVENPKAFIVAALALLKNGGKLIMTTPNKTKSPPGTIWQSDVPPVHLWWFSEHTFIYLSKELGVECVFLDFTPFTRKLYEYGADASIDQIQSSLPRLLKNGDVVPERKASNAKTKLLGVRLHSFLAHIKMRLYRGNPSARSASMCVIFTK